MKHLIRKIEYVTGDARCVFKCNIETSDIEQTRRELHAVVQCDRILLVYDSEADNPKQE